LGKRRWYERQEVKVKEVDEEAAARWKANELRRQEIEKEKKEEEEREKAKLARREEWVEGLQRDELERKVESLAKSRAIFENFARKAAKASIGKSAINLKVIRITGDYRVHLFYTSDVLLLFLFSNLRLHDNHILFIYI
jgi:ribosomal protein L9